MTEIKRESESIDSKEAIQAHSQEPETIRVHRTFLANLRHELCTPLNAIIGYSEMLLEDAQDEGQEDLIPDLQKIHTAGQDLLTLVNDILAPAKIAASGLESADDTSAMTQDAMATVRSLEDKVSAVPTDRGHLLVVDDNEMNRDILSRHLERQGHTVVMAENGRQALEMVKTHSFDLVLLDIKMPEMNGYEVCEHLKADEGTRDIPIIFISALDEIQDKVQAFTVGGVDYVTKPFQFEEVLARVENHLALRRLQKQLQDLNKKLQDANKKMERELALAGEVQASFLPRELPDIPGWQLSVTLRPARETSGDFYDINPLPNGRLGILIADVVDKGVGAALYMALSWTLIRTYAAEYPTQPELVLSAVNRRILEDTDADQFVTVFYGILDPVTGTLVYCNAGHNPPYLISTRNGEDVQKLTGTGLLLGVFEDATWEQGVVQLTPGDMLVLYTDGVAEAQDAQEALFGEDRLLESAKANLGSPALQGPSAQDIQDAIIETIYEFMGDAPQFDDITLAIVVRGSVVPLDD